MHSLVYHVLVEEFQSKNISTASTSFYDSRRFLAEESKDPDYLNKFAYFVASQPYSADYLLKAERTICEIVKKMSFYLKKTGLQSQCINMSHILARMLEEKGIWSTCIKGSCTINFPLESGLEKVYFYSISEREAYAGHTWLFSPPFNIIDLTLRQQPYESNEKKYLPEFILCKNGEKAISLAEDIISPNMRRYMLDSGVMESNFINVSCSQIHEIQASFPPLCVNHEKVQIKYSPLAITASAEKLIDMKNVTFDGKSPHELFLNEFSHLV